MHDVCVPILYHDVDISHHNDGGLWASIYPGVQAESDNPDRSEGPDPCANAKLRGRSLYGTIDGSSAWYIMDKVG